MGNCQTSSIQNNSQYRIPLLDAPDRVVSIEDKVVLITRQTNLSRSSTIEFKVEHVDEDDRNSWDKNEWVENPAEQEREAKDKVWKGKLSELRKLHEWEDIPMEFFVDGEVADYETGTRIIKKIAAAIRGSMIRTSSRLRSLSSM